MNDTGAKGTAESPTPAVGPLKILRRLYLCVHALSWIEIKGKDEREREERWGQGEHWPGRTETCHRLDLRLREKEQQLIRDIGEDEAVLFLPSEEHKGNRELIEFARKHLGPRCVVCRLAKDLDHNRKMLGPDFVKGIEEDRQRAMEARGGNLFEFELNAWEESKAWAIDLNNQLREEGYTYDPANVEFMAFGENWVGCGATYPIQMGRVFGLARPIERRFDLMNADWSPLLLDSTPVDQNLEMGEHVRLFIFKSGKGGPMAWTPSPDVRGRYIAQYWEGMRGIMDRPHVVQVDFPPASVREVDLFGVEVARARGLWADPIGGRVEMNVGGGVFTPYYSTMIMAEEGLPLEEFRAALLKGRVLPKKE